MRINIYAEEIYPGVSSAYRLIRKTADTGNEFIGLRIFLKSPEDLHHTEEDDDTSAVTFWFKDLNDAYSFVNRMRNALDRPEKGR